MSFYKDMYGGDPKAPRKYHEETPKIPQKENSKLPSRILGGLKAQNAHTKTITINEEDIVIPRIEYVAAIEKELRFLRNKDRENSANIGRLENQINVLTQKITAMKENIPRFKHGRV